MDGEDFQEIGAAFEKAHEVKIGLLGGATFRFMRQRDLVDYAVDWIENNRHGNGDKGM